MIKKIQNYIDNKIIEILEQYILTKGITTVPGYIKTEIFKKTDFYDNILNPLSKFGHIKYIIAYIDENGYLINYEQKMESLKEFVDFLKHSKLPDDVEKIKQIKIELWYYYKNDYRLEHLNFEKYNVIYDKSMFSEVNNKILKWFVSHPELLL